MVLFHKTLKIGFVMALVFLTSCQYRNDEFVDFMNIEAAGWGKDGANGGHVTMKVTDQSFEGDITVDAISSLDLTLDEGTSYTGAILSEGETDVTMNSGSTWTLSADTYITSLSGDTSGLDLNGYSLYVNGILYTA
jgi:hypothetical protein